LPARIKIRNIRNCQLEHHLAAIRPRVLGKASQPAQKVRGAQQFEAALFRAVVVDPVVHRALREVGQLLQPQSPLQRPDIIRRIEAASAATPA
jgi:hypothetical protein